MFLSHISRVSEVVTFQHFSPLVISMFAVTSAWACAIPWKQQTIYRCNDDSDPFSKGGDQQTRPTLPSVPKCTGCGMLSRRSSREPTSTSTRRTRFVSTSHLIFSYVARGRTGQPGRPRINRVCFQTSFLRSISRYPTGRVAIRYGKTKG